LLWGKFVAGHLGKSCKSSLDVLYHLGCFGVMCCMHIDNNGCNCRHKSTFHGVNYVDLLMFSIPPICWNVKSTNYWVWWSILNRKWMFYSQKFHIFLLLQHFMHACLILGNWSFVYHWINHNFKMCLCIFVFKDYVCTLISSFWHEIGAWSYWVCPSKIILMLSKCGHFFIHNSIDK